MGKANLVIPTGFDHSIAQTRSFASMYLAAVGLACAAGQHNSLLDSLKNIIPVGQSVIEEYEGQSKKWAENRAINQFFFLGSGIRYGLACEASLKLKEMSLSVSEPFHFLRISSWTNIDGRFKNDADWTSLRGELFPRTCGHR